MNRELLEKLQEESKTIAEKADKLKAIDRFLADMDMDNGYALGRRLEQIGAIFEQALKGMNQTPNSVSQSVYDAVNFSAVNELAKKSYVKSSIVNLYVDNMVKLVAIDNAVNDGSLSHLEAMKRLKDVVDTVSPYSKQITNINDINMTEMATAFATNIKDIYAQYVEILTPEQMQEVIDYKAEITPIKADNNFENTLTDNDQLEKQTSAMKESSREDSRFDSVASDVLAKFKRLDAVMEADYNSGMVGFDPNEVMYALKGLQNSVFDLEEISRSRGNIHDTSYTKYLDDMSVVFSEKTKRTRSALADFQTNTFESSIPQMRKLIEETRNNNERSEILKRFTKSAAWYMNSALIVQGQNSAHVDDVVRQVNDIIKSSSSIAQDYEQETKEREKKQTAFVNNKVREQVVESVKNQIVNSDIGPTLSNKEIDKMAEEIAEKTMEDVDVKDATSQAVAEAVEKVEDSVLVNTTSEIVDRIIEEKVESVVEEVVTERVEETVEAKIEETQESPKVDLTQMLKIDMDNTPVTKTREEVKEDIKWTIMNSVMESTLSDSDRFKGEDENTIKSIDSTFKMMASDGGLVVQLTDGSQQRVQSWLRNAFMSSTGIEDLMDKIATTSPELSDIIHNFSVAKQAVNPKFILDSLSQIEFTQADVLEDMVDSVMGSGAPGQSKSSAIQKEFRCENAYLGEIISQTQWGIGQDTLYNLVGADASYSSFDDLYENVLGTMENFQNATRGEKSDNVERAYSEDLSQNNGPEELEAKSHPLDRYKALIEQYDVQFVTDSNSSQGRFVVLDRATGQPPQYTSREQKDTLIRDLTFAKSWVSSCGADLSKTGDKNEYGVDPRQWEYSFNDGAQATYDWVIDAIQHSSGPDLRDKIIAHVAQNSNYQYAGSIVESLLRDRDNKELLNNIHNALLNDSGIELNNEIDEMSMNI